MFPTLGTEIEAVLCQSVENRPTNLSGRTEKLRQKIKEYFDFPGKADEYSLEQMDLVRRMTPGAKGYNDPADNKPIAPGDELFKRVKQIRFQLNKIDNAGYKEIALMKDVAKLNKMKTLKSEYVCKVTADRV